MDIWEKLRRFLAGRYGGDSLNTVICGFSLISFTVGVVLASACRGQAAGTVFGIIFYVLALAALGLAGFRMLSRNKPARRAEFEWYRSHISAPIAKRRQEAATRRAQRATHKFFRCPKCRQTVRVPRGKGKIRITCPKCGEVFVKKS
jgi:ribosomal protein S27E